MPFWRLFLHPCFFKILSLLRFPRCSPHVSLFSLFFPFISFFIPLLPFFSFFLFFPLFSLFRTIPFFFSLISANWANIYPCSNLITINSVDADWAGSTEGGEREDLVYILAPCPKKICVTSCDGDLSLMSLVLHYTTFIWLPTQLYHCHIYILYVHVQR